MHDFFAHWLALAGPITGLPASLPACLPAKIVDVASYFLEDGNYFGQTNKRRNLWMKKAMFHSKESTVNYKRMFAFEVL